MEAGMFMIDLIYMAKCIIYVKRNYFYLNNPYLTIKELWCLYFFLFEKTKGKLILPVNSGTIYELKTYIRRYGYFCLYHLEKSIIIGFQESFAFAEGTEYIVKLLRDFYTENPEHVKEIIKTDFDFAQENTDNFPFTEMSLCDYEYLKKISDLFVCTECTYTIDISYFCIKKNDKIIFKPTGADTLKELKHLVELNKEKEINFFQEKGNM